MKKVLLIALAMTTLACTNGLAQCCNRLGRFVDRSNCCEQTTSCCATPDSCDPCARRCRLFDCNLGFSFGGCGCRGLFPLFGGCDNGCNTGWAIGAGEEYEDHSYQDEVESRMLYDVLENEVVPTFYRRGADGLPREWIAMMKTSMMKICPEFNTNRMVEEYTERFYLPSILQWNWLAADGWAEAKKLAQWKKRVKAAWGEVRLVALATDQGNHHRAHQKRPAQPEPRLDAAPGQVILLQDSAQIRGSLEPAFTISPF